MRWVRSQYIPLRTWMRWPQFRVSSCFSRSPLHVACFMFTVFRVLYLAFWFPRYPYPYATVGGRQFSFQPDVATIPSSNPGELYIRGEYLVSIVLNSYRISSGKTLRESSLINLEFFIIFRLGTHVLLTYNKKHCQYFLKVNF